MSIVTKMKDKKFQETVISIGLILVLVYEGFSVMLYLASGQSNYFGILGLPSSMVCIVVIPFLFIFWRLMNGGKINIQTNDMSKLKPSKQPLQQPPFHNVNPQPIQEPPTYEPISYMEQQSYSGTWSCVCGNLAKGNFCNRCGRNKP